ncbi:MAG: HlyC/CorC family transporter [Acidobacteriota bacterium]|nr:MAG: HlyC/CorC family transporter [Acidobacteriota bacterium]
MEGNAQQLFLIVIALFLVFLNGYFVAAEFAIVKVRGTRLRELVRKGVRRADKAHRMVQNMDEYLSATQLGITVASLGLGWIGEPAFARVFESVFSEFGAAKPFLAHGLAAASAFLLITFLHIVLGELAPKSLAIQKAESLVLMTALPTDLFYRLSYPFIWLLNGTANLFLRALGFRPASELETVHSEEELRIILAHSHAQGILDRDAQRLLERVFDFGDRSVRQIMVPSIEVVYLDTEKSFQENLEIARKHRHTRYPLCEGSLDRIVGTVHVKDFLWRLQELGPEFDLRLLKRPVHFVPESKYIKDLLPEFRRTHTHLAVAVDEYGSTVGVVTLEDVLEELVGDIQDEFDGEMPMPAIQRKDERTYLVQGRTLLEQLETELDVKFDDKENDTIGGHVMMLLGRTARIGDEVTVSDRYSVRVVGMRGLQITDLSVEKLEGGETGEKRG